MDGQQPHKPPRDQSAEPLPFSEQQEDTRAEGSHNAPESPLPRSVDEVFATLETMSRSIRDLARELDCLGYFDDDDDRPKAA